MNAQGLALATFGGGCFWCTEAVFKELRGVESVRPGYCGGHAAGATYEQVCGGGTGHAEVVQIEYDPRQVSYVELLEVFFKTHDPTTLNRQGADTGTQYRSVVFCHDDAQRAEAVRIKQQLDSSGAFASPIVTQIQPAETFYPAEEYHHDYFARNPGQSYCAYVVGPKVEKFRQVFADRLKPGVGR
ncbi:MAG: peptide-methionine (S)-S-oxide reductase MsrA [Pirellulaceae bacterium]|nr:peptide-methionine (S)-S-oxide reductase MsrA [Pirellulaceae bacterium]